MRRYLDLGGPFNWITLVRGVAIAALAFLTVGVDRSDAGMINLQFGNQSSGGWQAYTGAGVVGAAGDYWNPSGFSASGLSLKDSNNSLTGVTFSNSGSGAQFTTGFTYGFQSTPYAALMKGYLTSSVNSSSPNTFTFAGLDNSKTYSLYIYSQGDSGANGRRLGVSIGGTTSTTTSSVATANTFILNQNYLLFSNLTPTAGQIQGTWWRVNGEANINGMQLLENGGGGGGAVPEPASAAIALIFLGGGALRKWRKMRRA
ncbi:MAG: hypothetical protein ACK5E3_12040 [Planctomycetota bacterium]|jgi:hypothetical protein